MLQYTEICLGQVKGRVLADKVYVIVANCLGLSVSMTPVKYDDTVATYLLVGRPTKDIFKLTKARIAFISAFMSGMYETLIACDFGFSNVDQSQVGQVRRHESEIWQKV